MYKQPRHHQRRHKDEGLDGGRVSSPPGPSNPYPGWGTSQGLYLLGAYDTTRTLSDWLTNQAGNLDRGQPDSATNGCVYLHEGSNTGLNDLAHLPPFDLYGNATTGLAYTNSRISNGTTV